jgi:uncharacterized membrane protein YeaQ/YmgE (transglycosylase-associated protein family)
MESSPNTHWERTDGSVAQQEEKWLMQLDMFVTWVLMGLIAGWLAGFVMKGKGYGLVADLLLGLFGSMVGGSIASGAGQFAMIVVALVGAASLIAGQRWWYARA